MNYYSSTFKGFLLYQFLMENTVINVLWSLKSRTIDDYDFRYINSNMLENA